MSYENMGRLMDHWLNYPPFREAMRKNPLEAIHKSGIQLTPQEMEAITSIDWSTPDESLQERISKWWA